jgi:hypothetical protein
MNTWCNQEDPIYQLPVDKYESVVSEVTSNVSQEPKITSYDIWNI